jgi:hypothetical protein
VLTATSSTSPAPSPVTLIPGVAGGRAPVSSRGRPWRRPMVNRRRLWSTACGLSPQPFPLKNNLEILENPNYLANSPLTFVPINPQSKSFTDFTPRSLVFEFYLQINLGPPILHINPLALSKLHILFTRAPVIF